jgi:transcriptional regulator with XRE-family HTH domain
MGNEANRRALADFLRKRRESIDPASKGLPVGRRRTPGLRREEVAILAGVSPSWYTYLEQGRDIQVSAQVVDSLTRVFDLNPEEHRYLQLLMLGKTGYRDHVAGDRTAQLMRQLVDSMDPLPTYVANKIGDLIAWNGAAAEWFGDFDALPPGRRNTVWWLLFEPYARECFVDWPDEARDVLARFRSATAASPDDPHAVELVEEFLALGSPVCDWWEAHEVHSQEPRIRRMRHPRFGLRSFHLIVAYLAGSEDTAILTHIPVHEHV